MRGWRRLDQMVTGIAPVTMASGGRRRSMSGSATGGERERAKVMGRIPCSPGARWSGRGGAGRSDGDGNELDRSGGRRTTATRFAGLEAFRQARVEEEEEELAVVLVVVFDPSWMVGNDGEWRRRWS